LSKTRRDWFSPVLVTLLCLTGFGAGAAEKGLWEREKLSGDWDGARSSLKDRGIEVGLNYIAETFSILRGGLRRGTVYEGRLDGTIETDLEKLMGWTGGKTQVRAFQIHKGRYNAFDNVGSLADPSNIDAVPTTRLFTAWFQQEFGKTMSIRLGQLAADDEFLVSTTAGGLINGTCIPDRRGARSLSESTQSSGPHTVRQQSRDVHRFAPGAVANLLTA
jgi:porin